VNIQSVKGLTWLLPTASIVALLYIGGAITLALTRDISIWLILLPAFPAVMLTWIALIVAFVDVTQRPKTQITDEARMVWLLLLALLNIFALLPYWLIVIRPNRHSTAG
jgi:hypothetical protein